MVQGIVPRESMQEMNMIQDARAFILPMSQTIKTSF